MASSVSLGAPTWCDGATYSGLLLRQFWAATKLYDHGTATAVSAPGGVFPGGGQFQVTAGSGLTVNVAAGYCAVPNATAGNGAYIFGMMTSGTLTVTASSTGYVVANVQDLATSGSFCQVEYVSTVPAASIALAQVVSGASTITTVTDQRTYVTPPGCLFPIANAAAAPAVPPAQPMYNLATGLPVTGTGTAGSVVPAGYTQVAGSSLVNTSSGAQGLTPGQPGTYPWGIGYGTVGGFNSDGYAATQMQVTFTADGTSDYEVYYKWQLSIPSEAYVGGPDTLQGCSVRAQLIMDGTQVDAAQRVLSDDPISAAGGGSASWYTSAAHGTTLSAGQHTAVLAFQTSTTYVYESYHGIGGVSGVFIGDVHASGGAIYGAGSTYLNALTAENCILRVMAVPVA
jgi:hypothetical protein